MLAGDGRSWASETQITQTTLDSKARVVSHYFVVENGIMLPGDKLWDGKNISQWIQTFW
jgi:hypothetical protein